MRQCGKTTLIKRIAKKYLTLDDLAFLSELQREDWHRIDEIAKPIAIDEAQLYPPLFSKIKFNVDEINQPGLYLLTGSVRFLDKKSIRESLTGRTSILELLPMSISECHEKPLFDIFNWMNSPNIQLLEKRAWLKEKDIQDYLNTGGMPGIYFKRNSEVRSRAWSVHLDTVLARDLRLIYPTEIPLKKLRSLFQLLAFNQGLPLNYASLARKIGVSQPTVLKLVRAMESLFLIRLHGKTVYCEDHGLAFHSIGTGVQTTFTALQTTYWFVYNEIKAQLSYRYPGKFELDEFKTRGGAYLPIEIQWKDRPPTALAITDGPLADDKPLLSVRAYLKRKPKAQALIIHRGKGAYLSGQKIPCIPWNWIA